MLTTSKPFLDVRAMLDCQWLQKLHTYGLLAGSFHPDDQVCVLKLCANESD